MIALAAMIKFVESAKLTRFSIQMRAPKIPIMPNSAVPTPPSAPIGVALKTAPNFGDRPSKIAPTPATHYAAVE